MSICTMRHLCGVLVLALVLAGCQNTKGKQAIALEISEENLAQREIQSRRYDAADQVAMLSACAGVLQDLGFAIDESAPQAGLLVASKDRDAVESGQVFMSLLLASITGVSLPWDYEQKIRVSIVAKPDLEKSTLMRVTFQRVVVDNSGRTSKVETINEPKIYQEFFDKLSQSIFLEGHDL